MKQILAFALLGVAAGQAGAVVIDAPGIYNIDSTVDELIVNAALSRSDVTINVVSGGVVRNDIRCAGNNSSCSFRANVTGNGTVLGRVLSEGALVDIRDDAFVGAVGTQSSSQGRTTVSGNAHVGLLTGSGGGGIGIWEIRGGVIDAAIWTPQRINVEMSGGILNTGFGGHGISLELRGGDILGTVSSDVLSMNLRMRDGHIGGNLMSSNGITGFIEGGSIDGNLRASFGGTLDIFGGQFGSNTLWTMGGGQIFNVWGRDLTLDGGRLTGWLLDGSRVDVGVNYLSTFRGQLNIANVPEPGTLALMGAGLLGAFAARRRRRAAR